MEFLWWRMGWNVSLIMIIVINGYSTATNSTYSFKILFQDHLQWLLNERGLLLGGLLDLSGATGNPKVKKLTLQQSLIKTTFTRGRSSFWTLTFEVSLAARSHGTRESVQEFAHQSVHFWGHQKTGPVFERSNSRLVTFPCEHRNRSNSGTLSSVSARAPYKVVLIGQF